jgi:outer membrane scaffolding protein for murein synthesis (MipA/OmpV family)
LRFFAPVLLATALLASPAVAQDALPEPAADTDRSRLTIGLGAVSLPDYEGADTNDWYPGAVLVGKYEGFEFFTRGAQLYIDLIRDAPGPGTGFELGVIGSVRRERSNGIDNARVEALGEIDTAYEAGGFVGVTRTGVITSDFDTLTARVAVVSDVGNTHNSYVITPQLTYTTPLSPATLVSVGVAADYVGKGYGGTYYSVSPAGSLASGLRAYDARDAGWKNLNFAIFGLQSLTGDLRRGLGIGGGVQYGKVLGRYKRSPLVRDVGDADQWTFAVGLAYTF